MDRRTLLLRSSALVAAALLLRLYQLGAQPLWYDEVFSWIIASSPDFWAELTRENSPPLYYLLLRGVLGLLGHGELQVRLLSALLGAGFVAACMVAARRLGSSPGGALAAGAFAALAPYHVYYSQEGRAYALLALLLVWSWAALARAVERGGTLPWLAVALPTWLACATHPLAALGLAPGLALVLPSVPGRWRRLGAFALVGAVGALITGGWLFFSARYAALEVLQLVWEATPPELAIPRSLEQFLLGAQQGTTPIFLKQLTSLAFPTALRALALVSGAVLLGVALLSPGTRSRPARGFLALALLGPLAVLWLASALGKPLYLVGRYDLVAFPAVPLLIGLGVSQLLALPRGRIAAAVLGAALALPMGWKLWGYYQAPAPTDDTVTAELLARHLVAGDRVVLTGTRGPRVLWELILLGTEWDRVSCRRGDLAFGCDFFPTELAHELSARVPDQNRVRGSPEAIRADARKLLGALPPGASLWLVVGNTRLVGSQVRLGEQEEALLRELTAGGLHLAPFAEGMSIVRLQR